MKFYVHFTKAIIQSFFKFGKFFIVTYGIFLKFFLKLNGGYWGRIGIGKYSMIERKRYFCILPFYVLLAFLFGFLSFIYWYFVVLFIPLSIERYLTDTIQLNNSLSTMIAFSSFFGWLLILSKTK